MSSAPYSGSDFEAFFTVCPQPGQMTDIDWTQFNTESCGESFFRALFLKTIYLFQYQTLAPWQWWPPGTSPLLTFDSLLFKNSLAKKPEKANESLQE
jgi:hypothetical protein